MSVNRAATATERWRPTSGRAAARRCRGRPAGGRRSPRRESGAHVGGEPEMSPRPSSRPNRNRPGSSASAALGLNRRVQVGDQSPDVGSSPTLARTAARPRCCAPARGTGEGNRPAPRRPCPATAAVSVMPRIWRLPREVSSMPGEPNRVAASASSSNCPADDHAARQPHSGQRAVCGRCSLQRARAGVVVAGSRHQITVRRDGSPATTCRTDVAMSLKSLGAGVMRLCQICISRYVSRYTGRSIRMGSLTTNRRFLPSDSPGHRPGTSTDKGRI